MPALQIPYRLISGLPPKAQQEIWRDFEAVRQGSRKPPFIVVAADGTGDFTSLQGACDSVGTTPSFIYVQSTTDLASHVLNLQASCDITLFGVPDNSIATISGQNDLAGAIAIGGISGGNSASKITFYGMSITCNSNLMQGLTMGGTNGFVRFLDASLSCSYLFDGSAGGFFIASNSVIMMGGLTNSLNNPTYVNAVFLDSIVNSITDVANFGTTNYTGDAAPSTIVLRRCDVTFGNQPVAMGAHFTGVHGGWGFTFELTDCIVRQAGNGTPAYDFWFYSISTSGGGNNCLIERNRWETFQPLVTFHGGRGATLTISDNVSVSTQTQGISNPTITGGPQFTLDGADGPIEAVMEANNLPGTGVTLNVKRAKISGKYRNIVLQAGADECAYNVVFDAAVNTSAGFVGTFLSVASAQTIGMAAFGGIGGTTQAYAFTGASSGNILFATGISTCSTASTDAGAGNQINSLPPTGGASGSLAGSFPGPIFAGRDSSVDKLNQDMLPTLLAPAPGIQQYPAAASGLTQAQATDNARKDLIPALYVPLAGVVVYPTPAPGSNPTGPAGGSLASTYPNPLFAGRDSSVDKINQDLLPALLVPPAGIVAYPAVAPTTDDARNKTLIPTLYDAKGITQYPTPLPTIPEANVTGLVTDLDQRRKDLIPALLVPDRIVQYPTPGIPESGVTGLVTDLDQLHKSMLPTLLAPSGIQVAANPAFGQVQIADTGAGNGPSGLFYGAPEELRSKYLKPTGSYETFSRFGQSIVQATIPTALGTIFLTAIALPKNFLITNINFYVGAAIGTPTHWWLALCNNLFVTLRSTADKLTTAQVNNTKTIVPLASTFRTVYEGVYYIAYLQAGTTLGTTYGSTGLNSQVPASELPRTALTGLTAQTVPLADGTNLATVPAAATSAMWAFVT